MTLPDCIDFEDAVDETYEEEYFDEDADYDRWADDRVGDYFQILQEREELYKKLLLCDHHSNHNDERDELEKKLVYNLTRNKDNWIDMNSIHSEEW